MVGLTGAQAQAAYQVIENARAAIFNGAGGLTGLGNYGTTNGSGGKSWFDKPAQEPTWRTIVYADSANRYLGECPSICKIRSGIGATGTWERGRLVWDNMASIVPGTVMAAFPNGEFDGHAALFTGIYGTTSGGVRWVEVFDQYTAAHGGTYPRKRVLNENGNNSNGGPHFYTVKTEVP